MVGRCHFWTWVPRWFQTLLTCGWARCLQLTYICTDPHAQSLLSLSNNTYREPDMDWGCLNSRCRKYATREYQEGIAENRSALGLATLWYCMCVFCCLGGLLFVLEFWHTCVCAYTLKSLQQVPFSLGMPSREVWVWLPPGYAEGMSLLHLFVWVSLAPVCSWLALYLFIIRRFHTL